MKIIFFLLMLLLSTQLGRHFWPSFSYIQGIRVDYLSPTIYLTDIIVILLFVTWLIKEFQISNFKFQIFKRYWPLVVLAPMVIGVAIYLSKSPLAGAYGLIRIVEFIFFGFITAKVVMTKNDFGNVVNLLTVGLVFQSALAIVQFIKQGSVGNMLWFLGERTFTGTTAGVANAVVDGQLLLRPYGTFSHPNVLAGFLVIAMILIMANLKKLIFYISLGLGTLALILTMSRVAILLWTIILLWMAIKNKKPIFILVVFVALVPIIIGIGSIGAGRVLSINEESFVRRQELTMVALSMVKSSPLWGVGINNFLVNLPQFQQTKSTILYLQPVHNIYLLIAVETGVIGLLFFMWFMWKTYRNLKSQISHSASFHSDDESSSERAGQANLKTGLLTTLAAILFLGFFDHYFLTLQQGQLLFALTLGLCWSKIKERIR